MLVPYPATCQAHHRVLVPEHQQFSLLGQVPTEHQDGEGGYKANFQVDNLERRPGQPTINASTPQVTAQISRTIEYSSVTGLVDPDGLKAAVTELETGRYREDP